MRYLALLLYIFCSNATARPLPYFSKNDLTPFWPDEKASAAPPATVPAFGFVDQNGAPVHELPKHITLVNFFFTSCPSVCPLMMTRLAEFRRRLPPRSAPAVYSISVDPETDQPPVLALYAKKHHLNLPNWELLTGPRREIYELGRAIFHADGSQQDVNFIHSTNVYLVDSQHHIRGIYDTGNKKDMALLAKDMANLRSDL